MKKLVVVVIAIALSMFFYSCSSTKDIGASKIYKNEEYGISLAYPATWKPNNSYMPARYEGENGFFQYSAIAGGQMDIDDVTSLDAEHKLMPYGSSPQIESLSIAGQEARLIMPSEDQPIEMNKQAGLIIKYPRGVIIGGELYEYFELWADVEHIRSIGESIRFLE